MLAPAVAVSAPAAIVLADAASTGGIDPYTLIGSLITPVIVVVLLLTNRLHTAGDYDRLREDRDAEHAERTRLQEVVNDRVIPGMARSTLVMEAILPLVENEVRLRAAREQQPGGG